MLTKGQHPLYSGPVGLGLLLNKAVGAGLVCFWEAVPTQAMSAPPGLCWESPQAAQTSPGGLLPAQDKPAP